MTVTQTRVDGNGRHDMADLLADTQAALDGGVGNAPPEAAVQLIDGWVSKLTGAGFAGADQIVSDLQTLKSELGKPSPDLAAGARLMTQLGTATSASASGITTDSDAQAVRKLGTALSSSGA